MKSIFTFILITLSLSALAVPSDSKCEIPNQDWLNNLLILNACLKQPKICRQLNLTLREAKSQVSILCASPGSSLSEIRCNGKIINFECWSP